MSSSCTKDVDKIRMEPPNPKSPQVPAKMPSQQVPNFTSSWAIDDFLHFSDPESSDKSILERKEHLEFGELEWVAEMCLFGEHVPQEALAAAEVPELPSSHSGSAFSCRAIKSSTPFKKPRIEVEDDEEFFTVPDLG